MTSDNQSTAKPGSGVIPTIKSLDGVLNTPSQLTPLEAVECNLYFFIKDNNLLPSAYRGHLDAIYEGLCVAMGKQPRPLPEVITTENLTAGLKLENISLRQELAQMREEKRLLYISVDNLENELEEFKSLPIPSVAIGKGLMELIEVRKELATTREQLDHLSQFKDCHRNNDGVHGHGSAALCVPCENELRQELAQAKEEISSKRAAYDILRFLHDKAEAELRQAKEKFHEMLEEREQMRERMKTLEHAVYTSKKDLAALEGKLGEERKRCLAIIAERPGPTAEAYELVCKANSKKADQLQILEGKLGEMRKALESGEMVSERVGEDEDFYYKLYNEKLITKALSSLSSLSKCEKTPSAIADGNSPTLGAALEPIKKEEKL